MEGKVSRYNCFQSLFMVLFLTVLFTASSQAQRKHAEDGNNNFEFSFQLGSAYAGNNVSGQLLYSFRKEFDIGYGVNAVRWSSQYDHNDVTHTILFNFYPDVKIVKKLQLAIFNSYTLDPLSNYLTIEPQLYVKKKFSEIFTFGVHLGLAYAHYKDIDTDSKYYRNIGFSLDWSSNAESFGYNEFSFVRNKYGTTFVSKFGFYF